MAMKAFSKVTFQYTEAILSNEKTSPYSLVGSLQDCRRAVMLSPFWICGLSWIVWNSSRMSYISKIRLSYSTTTAHAEVQWRKALEILARCSIRHSSLLPDMLFLTPHNQDELGFQWHEAVNIRTFNWASLQTVFLQIQKVLNINIMSRLAIASTVH